MSDLISIGVAPGGNLTPITTPLWKNASWWHGLLATLPNHDDVIKWKHFTRSWLFVWGIHRWPVNSPHKGQWRGALMFSLICTWINGWVDNGEAGDLRSHGADYDVTVMNECEYPSELLSTATSWQGNVTGITGPLRREPQVANRSTHKKSVFRIFNFFILNIMTVEQTVMVSSDVAVMRYSKLRLVGGGSW